jgi:hypothetical protein
MEAHEAFCLWVLPNRPVDAAFISAQLARGALTARLQQC